MVGEIFLGNSREAHFGCCLSVFFLPLLFSHQHVGDNLVCAQVVTGKERSSTAVS